MTKAFLKEHLQINHGLEVSIPEGEAIDQSHYFVSKELTQGQFTQAAKDFYTDQIRLFKDKGMDAVILGCTELPILLNDAITDLPVLATTDLHIQMAVDFILSEV
jgi:aspartate racemase